MSVAPREELSRWNLSPYFDGPDDPRVEAELGAVRAEAQDFLAAYQGRIASLRADQLREALERYDAIGGRLSDLADFGFLTYCLDTRDERAQALNTRMGGETAMVRMDTAFLHHELQDLAEEAFQALCEAEALAPWRETLSRLRRRAPHALEDAVERAITRKEQSGIQAWRQLYTTLTSSRIIRMPSPQGAYTVSVAEANRLMTSPNRATRRAATEASIQSIVDRTDVITAVFNAVLEDVRVNAELRGFSLPYGETLIDEDLDASAVEAMLSAVESRYDLVHRYMGLKARALGIEDFSAWDINAPMAAEPPQYSFSEARRIVHDAYTGFHPRVGQLIDRFFTDGYIDAAPAPNKWAGAFCSWSTPGRHPYLLISYTNRIRDLLTLAHELGHGVHYAMTGAFDRYMNLRISMFSETPSTFGELLAFERLVAEAPSHDVRRTLLGAWLDTTVGTLFLQVAMTRWEQQIHAARHEGPLAAETFRTLWMQERRRLFGPEVELPEWVSQGWLVHQHAVNMPFYSMSYPFGLMMVYGLRQRYREEGSQFAEAFVGQLLEGGLSPAVATLLKRIDVDMHDVGFWHKGLNAVEALIDEFEATLDQAPEA
ncbi:MAG: M3 family metallopeptidase [Candidatus Sericytochromatia bacterium]|nr:M3 family metallopeptidase [Candidatus Sericytochromatia bacterium]